MSGEAPELVASTRDGKRAEGWTLALTSQGVPSVLRRIDGVWHLGVPAEQAAHARTILTEFEGENAPAPPEPPPAPEWGRNGAGVVLAIALLGAHLLTTTHPASAEWFQRGSADARAILGGETWRTVTALTLHADVAHVLGNALSCALFATAVFWVWGPGLGGALVLLSGILGNLANAFYHGGPHISVGASTALFGAIGLLAGSQFAARRRSIRHTRAWIPLAGALGLVAMLGTGARADLSAHLFGLLAGVGLGAAARVGIARPPGMPSQVALGLAAVASVALAWRLALG